LEAAFFQWLDSSLLYEVARSTLFGLRPSALLRKYANGQYASEPGYNELRWFG
jgi:hypothetical protein